MVEPPDTLLIEVLEALPGRPISGERLVRPDGTVSLGYYGDVHVAGLTLQEVKEKVILHLAKCLTDENLGILAESDDPSKPKAIEPKDSLKVFVDLVAYNSQNYYVEGEVNQPSRLPYTGNDTVLDVIHHVGGIKSSADRSQIRLIRSYPKGSSASVMPINYEEITMGTDSSTNYRLLPNDRLVVPHLRDDLAQPQVSERTAPPHSSRQERDFYSARSAEAATDAKQLESLQALERHLKEVETKLDKLIAVMQSATQAARRREGQIMKPQNSAPQPKGNPLPDDGADAPAPADAKSPCNLRTTPAGEPDHD